MPKTLVPISAVSGAKSGSELGSLAVRIHCATRSLALASNVIMVCEWAGNWGNFHVTAVRRSLFPGLNAPLGSAMRNSNSFGRVAVSTLFHAGSSPLFSMVMV